MGLKIWHTHQVIKSPFQKKPSHKLFQYVDRSAGAEAARHVYENIFSKSRINLAY